MADRYFCCASICLALRRKLERNHDRTASVIEVRVEDIDRLGRKVEQ
jgi:hypothetical protein